MSGETNSDGVVEQLIDWSAALIEEYREGNVTHWSDCAVVRGSDAACNCGADAVVASAERRVSS